VFVRVFWKEGDGERVDGELGHVGGEAEGQPGRVSHRERLVELGGKGVEVGAKAATGMAGPLTRRVTDPRSLTLVVTARGRIQFASLRTRAAMSGKVATIRDACACSEGEEQGAKNLLSAVRSDFGTWLTGTLLLAEATLAAVRELIFFLPLVALDEAALAYDGLGLGQSGARCPAMKVVGSGYLPSRKAFASHESLNLCAYARGSP